ncbi:ileal sodium/bile acid cotransporter-like [Mercenaria mercenaria]|uniref:ileal sodium/bile acid cotransporter-like n=1 Tax=Mercenaria mercenaria TaxID=6596 RepID=UPI00234E4085|nr:ileal sodium/bile acid cotransporter-like [Mercenaria mercenaria]
MGGMFVFSIVTVISLTTGISAAQNLPFEVFTQSGTAFNVNPVKVTSEDDVPLLMFYLVNSSLKPRIEVYMDTDFVISFDYSIVCVSRNVSFLLTVSVPGQQNLEIIGNAQFKISCENAKVAEIEQSLHWNKTGKAEQEKILRRLYIADGRLDIQMQSGIIGYNDVKFSIEKAGNKSENMDSSNDIDATSLPSNVSSFVILDPENSFKTLTYTIRTIRKMRPIDKLFRVIVYAVQIFVATGFGAKLDLQVVKENLFRPVAPGIGLACQYLLMPLIAFGASRAVSAEMPTVALGIFLAGCCPGGGASNTYTYLLKGDLSLSITMTALSTVAALAMLPFWLYTLGSVFIAGEEELSIPFEIVAVSLSVLILPLIGGVLLKHKFPKAADRLQKILKPFIVVMALVLIIVGVLANLYIFRLFKPKIIAAACLLPYVGYICGGVIAAIFRQPWAKIKTISIETGMQNTSIAYILLINSFPAPSGDLAAVAPVASAVMTPLPPFIVTVFYLTYQSWKKRRGAADETCKTSLKNDEEAATEDGADERLMTEMASADMNKSERGHTEADDTEKVKPSSNGDSGVSDDSEQTSLSQKGKVTNINTDQE